MTDITPEEIAAEMGERPEITPDLIRAMLRGHLAVVKPGETLILRTTDLTPNQMREYQDAFRWLDDLPFKVLVVHADELGVAEPGAVPAKGDPVIIEWPVPRNGSLPGFMTALRDAATGEMMPVTRLTVTAEPSGVIRAAATVLADEGDNVLFVPAYPVADKSGEDIRTVDMEFEVAEMRIGTPA